MHTFAGRLVQFIDDTDNNFLRSCSEIAYVRNKVFWQLIRIFLFPLQIWTSDVTPVVLEFQVPALVLSRGKHVTEFTFFVEVLLNPVEYLIFLFIWGLLALQRCSLKWLLGSLFLFFWLLVYV